MNYDVMKSIYKLCCRWILVVLTLAVVNFDQSCQTRLPTLKENVTETIIKLVDNNKYLFSNNNITLRSKSSNYHVPSNPSQSKKQRRDVANITNIEQNEEEAPEGIIKRIRKILINQHDTIALECDVGIPISNNIWLKDGQIVDVFTKGVRGVEMGGHRFIKEDRGGVFINRVRLEDNGRWQCEAEDDMGFVVTGNPIYLIVLDRPKPPYLLIDGRRLDPGNIFIPVKENSNLSIQCITEGGNPKPTLIWQLKLSNHNLENQENINLNLNLTTTDDSFDNSNVDRSYLNLNEHGDHSITTDEFYEEFDNYRINSGSKSEATLPKVYRGHHNATIACVVKHPTVSAPLNASLLLDVQYAPSFGLTRIPPFGVPLQEGMPVSLKCDVDSNPPSTPVWQREDGEPPVPQSGDGFLNFTAIRKEHTGWYKCTSRYLRGRFSSLTYFLPIGPLNLTQQEADITGNRQVDVDLGGAVLLQCPNGSVGCWAHDNPTTHKPRGLGGGGSEPTASFNLSNIMYQDSGVYRCIGQPPGTGGGGGGYEGKKSRLEVLRSIEVQVKGSPLVFAAISHINASVGQSVDLAVEFCANPPATRAWWINSDIIYRPGRHYGNIIAHNITNMTNIHCQEALLTIQRVEPAHHGEFYFLVKSSNGLTETVIIMNVTPTETETNTSSPRNQFNKLLLLVTGILVSVSNKLKAV